jgi:hypothetical protein
MLACGVIPVVGESAYSKASIDNPFLRWASPTPMGLADALSEVVRDGAGKPAEIAASIRTTPWDEAKRVTRETIEDEVYGRSSTN